MQFLIRSGNLAYGIFKKYRRARYFLISAFVRMGAIISPITTIMTTEMIAVTFVDTMFY
jgi:hypothetical protein